MPPLGAVKIALAIFTGIRQGRACCARPARHEGEGKEIHPIFIITHDGKVTIVPVFDFFLSL